MVTTPHRPVWKIASIICGVLAILFTAIALISLMLLDSDWLRGELEGQAGASLRAEVSIGGLEFSPWSGRVGMTDFTLKRDQEGDKFDAKMKQAEAEVRVLPLILRKLIISRLYLREPDIAIETTREPEPDAKPTIERLKDAGRDLLGNLKSGSGKSKPKKKPSEALRGMQIGEIRIEKGAVTYTAHREGVEPFVAQLNDLNYSARDVSPESLGRLLTDCALKSEATLGTKADVEFVSTSKWSQFRLERLDVGYVDRYFSQKDALAFQGGTMHIRADSGDGSLVKVRIEGLRLARNMNAPTDEFYFIPVDKLVDYVNSRSGNLNLEFKQDGTGIEGSDDLEAIALQFWDGMCAALVDEVRKSFTEDAGGKAKSVLEKGRNLIRDSLRKEERKDSPPQK